MAGEWSALLAVRDFNARRSPPYPNMTIIPSNCNVRLNMTHQTYETNSYRALGLVYQDHVLVRSGGGPEPLAVLGGLMSSNSALLAVLGAVAGSNATATSSSSGGILNVSPLSTSSGLDDPVQYPFFARTIPSNDADAEALCLYLKQLGVTQVAVVYLISNYGLYYYSSLLAAAQKHNISVYPFSFRDNSTLTQSVQVLRSTPLTFVVAAIDLGYWSQVLPLLYELGFGTVEGSNYTWIFTDSLAVELETDLWMTIDNNNATSTTQNATSIGAWLNRSAVLSLQPSSVGLQVQQDEFLQARNDPVFQELWNQSHPGNNTKHQNSSDVPVEVPTPSLLSLLTYDAVFALGYGACQLLNPSDALTSINLYNALEPTGLEFQGASGRVILQNKTLSRDPIGLTYWIRNILYDERQGLSLVPVASWEVGAPNVTMLAPMIYPSGSTDVPNVVTPATVNAETIPFGVLMFVYISTAVAMGFSLFCGAWTVIYRKQPKVRASQPVFLVLLCCGSFLVASSTIFTTFQPPMSKSALNAGCMANPWFLSIGLTTIFAALFSKTWRINRLFRSAKVFRRVTIRVRDVLWPLFILLAINVVILTTWTVVDPLQWNVIPLSYDSYDRLLDVRFSCYVFDDSQVSKVCLILMATVNLIALLLLNVESYRARGLPTDFNESGYIAITNLILLEASIISIPILFVVRNYRPAAVLIRSVLSFLMCMAVLLPAFVPKFG